jgi:hypothetical protein
MIKKSMVICILLLILILNIVLVKGDYFDGEYNDEKIKSGQYRYYSFSGNKGDDIHFNIRSDIPVNCYIIKTPDKTNLMIVGGEVDNNTTELFKKAELTKENKTKIDFKWTIPANIGFLLVVTNPNVENATVSIRHSTPVYDRIRWTCYFIIIIGLVIVTIMFYIYYVKKKKNQLQHPPPQQQSSPPIIEDKS